MKLFLHFYIQILFLFCPLCFASPNTPPIPTFGVPKEASIQENDSPEFITFYYNQTLDNFNYNPIRYTTFEQRYVINFKYWGDAKDREPIFCYFGAEAAIDYEIGRVGFLIDNVPKFKALEIYIEHRFYGKSIPVPTRELIGYFSSAQAIADYAEILLFIKDKYSPYSPVIVIGGSYGGMLASWFLLRYPHISLGVLASSAPILYFDGITPQNGYFSIVCRDFMEVSPSCYATIKNFWSEIDRLASIPGGLSILNQKFKICWEVNSSSEVKNLLIGMLTWAAQYRRQDLDKVTAICDAIGGKFGGSRDDSILDRVAVGVPAFYPNQTCYFTTSSPIPDSETIIPQEFGWNWQNQRCIAMVMPIEIEANETMFQPAPSSMESFINSCIMKYGVPPRPHWITANYGGRDIKLILATFGTNIIFSNGLRDPYSSGGVLEDILDSIISITTVQGSHCMDLLKARKSNPTWLRNQ